MRAHRGAATRPPIVFTLAPVRVSARVQCRQRQSSPFYSGSLVKADARRRLPTTVRSRIGGCLRRAPPHNGGMGNSAQGTYTAKLTDGPLEGTTVTTEFLDSGDPRPRLEIPAEKGKRYLYARSAGLEFDSPEHPEQPSAVDYRYLQALFDTPATSS